MENYFEVELADINSDTINSWEFKSKTAAINKAIRISKKYFKSGVGRDGCERNESVWINEMKDGDLARQWQFENGQQVYFTVNS